MSIYIIITVIIVIVIAYYKQRNRSQINRPSSAPAALYSINDGNQDSLIYYVEYDAKWFEDLDTKYSWENFDPYDNRYFEYMYRLFDELPKQKPQEESRQEFFNKLTRGQKVFLSQLVFGGDVDNGGVYQFFFNKSEYSLAVLESFEELKLHDLKRDYETCLNELLGSVDKLKKRKATFNDESKDWEKRWNAFSAGYAELPSAKKIEDYFYSDENRILRYKAMVDYIDAHLDQFVRK